MLSINAAHCSCASETRKRSRITANGHEQTGNDFHGFFQFVFIRIHSWLRWTSSIYEKHRARHIPGKWDRRCNAEEPSGARLAARNHRRHRTEKHVLVS